MPPYPPNSVPARSPARLYRLEAVRGFAALYIMLAHTVSNEAVIFGIPVAYMNRFGQEAVVLFFLVSGFVINYSFRNSRDKSFSSYLFKRGTRIYIPLLLVFLVSYASHCYNHGALVNPELWTLLKNILMLQDYEVAKPNVLSETYLQNTSLWSLSYEWWFYMLYFPIATRIAPGYRQAVLVFAVSMIAAALYVWQPNFLARFFVYLGIWWAGVYLSELYMAGKHRSLKALALPVMSMFALSLVLVVPVVIARLAGEGLQLGRHPLLEFRHVSAAALLVCGAYMWQRIHWFGFDSLMKPFMVLAPISYALYISHLPLMAHETYLDFIDHEAIRWFCSLLVMLIFSYLVELKIYPSLREYLRNRWFSLDQPRTGTGGARGHYAAR